MSTTNIQNIKWNTRQRLNYIEVKAFYTGVVSRSDVAQTFAMSDPAATKDLKLYNDLAPKNLIYKQSEFGFIPNPDFSPILSTLAPALGLNLIMQNTPSQWLATEGAPIYGIAAEGLPQPLRLPSKEIVSNITRAIFQGKKLSIHYASLSERGDGLTRLIEPHSLVNTGVRWHVRAYNEDSFDFRDFVLSRMLDAKLSDEAAESSQEYDEEWMESIDLKLSPHPQLSAQQQLNILADYSEDGTRIEFSLRRALIGYVLNALSVDTTEDQSLNPNAHPLVLLNRDEIEIYAQWALEKNE
ncbi:MAG: WYL domain-containing protein [Arenicellales bacterium]